MSFSGAQIFRGIHVIEYGNEAVLLNTSVELYTQQKENIYKLLYNSRII